MPEYDFISIGSGPAGYSSALHAARLGAKVAVVEKGVIGGECLNYACIPFKSLLHHVKLYYSIRKCIESGVCKGDVKLDVSSLNSFRSGIVSKLRGNLIKLMERNGIEIYYGEAYKIRDGSVYIKSDDGGKAIEGKNILLALGSRPKLINGVKVDGLRVLTSRDAVDLKNIQGELAVIGGGPVGIEVATLYNALGCRVSIFEMMNTLLPGLDRDISKRLEYNLRRMGIKVYTSKKILKVKTGDKVYVYLEDGSRYSFDNIVLAIGRTPNTDNDLIRGIDLKLDEKGFIVVDGMQATNIKGIYAAGDVTGPPMLAHKAYFEGLNAAESIVNKRALRKPDYIPLTVYSYPEVFTIGLSEYGHDYLESVKIPLTVSGKAFSEDVKGLIKIVYSRRDRRVYGIHIIGDIASSLSELSTVIVESSLKYDLIIDTLFPHPSYGEAIWEALAYLEGMSIHLD
ncbi:hypothetical protein DRN84_00220 [Candidatus Geothermarchaeota archaeon]|nr:MAG: hypothetical protein DRN84_00220 [Candidatus Geothermarchaeota archaeon]